MDPARNFLKIRHCVYLTHCDIRNYKFGYLPSYYIIILRIKRNKIEHIGTFIKVYDEEIRLACSPLFFPLTKNLFKFWCFWYSPAMSFAYRYFINKNIFFIFKLFSEFFFQILVNLFQNLNEQYVSFLFVFKILVLTFSINYYTSKIFFFTNYKYY